MNEQAASGTTTTTIAKPAVVANTKPVKLTNEEQNTRYTFIGKCVDKGINFPSNNKFGVVGAMSVQDLCTSNIKTLQDVAIKIKREQDGHDPEFSGTEELKINGILASEWLTFMRLTIRKKNWDAYASKMRTDKRVLQSAIDAAKTPEELRKEAQQKLNEIGSEFDED